MNPYVGGLALEDTAPTLDTKEKEGFYRFARKMLRWMPEDRDTAIQLLKDPWFQTQSSSHMKQSL